MTTTPGQAPTERAAETSSLASPSSVGGDAVAPLEQAPSVPGAPPVKKTERPHPLTPLIRGWLVFLAFIVYFLRDLVPDGSNDGLDVDDLGWILPIVGAVVVIAAVAGFFTWYFTRFVIDDEELRIETGWVFKKSKKIPFERLQSVDIIQPLAARIFGLAELRLEAGAGDSTTKLRYLTRRQSSRLRDYLLARAHGEQARISDLESQAPANFLTDLGATDHPLVTVPPQRLVFGLLLSSEWIISMLFLIAAVVTTAIFQVVQIAFSALIPLVIGAVTMVSRRVISMFNFTLAESPRGLRITRGLTNLTSQSVPINRLQGVKVSQPLLWKPTGWYRVDVDVVGYASSGDGENNESQATNVLLPVATRAEVDLALSRALPGFDLDGIELHPVPRRARWLRWFDWWTLRYGWDDRALITEHGWMIHARDIVPHAKTQSVRILQGPLQRRLRLADVHIDTPKGPVNLVAHQLDAQVARELTLTQLDRARAARAADRQHRPVDQVVDDHAGEDALLAAFGTGRDRLLGAGGESEVFALDEERVFRLYRRRHEAPEPTISQLRALYGMWAQHDIGIEVPLILDTGFRDGRAYTIDRRFSGRPFSGWLATAERTERRDALRTFLDAASRLAQLPSPVPGFARLVGGDAPAQFGSLTDLARNMLARPTRTSREHLARDVPDVGRVWDRLMADLAERQVAPALVHGDICPPNAYVSLGPDGPVVTGIGDFSPHTVHGDPMMDVTGTVAFLELEPYADAAGDALWLEGQAVERFGPDTAHWIDVYRRFYGFYFSDAGDFDPALYGWCLRQLDRP
jgi:putative membrane protein